MDKKLKELTDLLEERDKARQEYNQYIIDHVADTVGVAVYKLLALTPTDVIWDDIQVIGPGILFQLSITYNPTLELSEFLRLVDRPHPDESPVSVKRQLTIGLPITMVFETPEVIEAFALSIANGVDPLEALATVAAKETEPELSPEQQKQMLLFQHMTPGKMQ